MVSVCHIPQQKEEEKENQGSHLQDTRFQTTLKQISVDWDHSSMASSPGQQLSSILGIAPHLHDWIGTDAASHGLYSEVCPIRERAREHAREHAG